MTLRCVLRVRWRGHVSLLTSHSGKETGQEHPCRRLDSNSCTISVQKINPRLTTSHKSMCCRQGELWLSRISSYILLQGCLGFCPISQFFVMFFYILFFLHVFRISHSFWIIFPPLLSSLYTTSTVQEQSLSPMKVLPHQPFLLTSCGFDCYITCFLFCCVGVFLSFKTLSSMY